MAQNNSLFEEGNAAYNESNYTDAIRHYEQILENGEESAEVYFNLANAHYKLNNVAPSVYYYEKALQIDPGDKDIQNNLAFAENMVMDDIQEVEKSGFDRIWNNIISVLSYNQWAWLAVILSFCLPEVFTILFQ